MESGYSPKDEAICVDCVHHCETKKRKLFGGFKILHDCEAYLNERDRITGEPKLVVYSCSDINGTEWCKFETTQKTDPVQPPRKL